MKTGGRIYIIGFMGSGKSTAGEKLASIIGWQFIDLDTQIELKAGQSIDNIFSSSGEDHFREIEEETLLNLKIRDNTVISTGGGTPCYGSNMEFMLKTGLVLYLRMTPDQLKNRLEGSTDRPLIKNIDKNLLLKYISDKVSEREKYYLQASIIADGDDLDIKSLSNLIITKLTK